jgi:DNA-binding transcriptional regulator LsrR (DeoR family)
VVGLSPVDLRAIPTALLASGGLDKVPVIRAALRAGYVNTLITDEAAAEALCTA